MDRGRIRTDNPGRSTVELRDRPPVTGETGLDTVTAPENEGMDVAGRLCVAVPSFLPTYGWGVSAQGQRPRVRPAMLKTRYHSARSLGGAMDFMRILVLSFWSMNASTLVSRKNSPAFPRAALIRLSSS